MELYIFLKFLTFYLYTLKLMKFKLFSFDYWDTIVPIDAEKVENMRKERAFYLSKVFKEWGYEINSDLIKYISHEIWEIYKSYDETKEITLKKIVSDILLSLKIEIDDERVEKVVKIYEDFLIKAGFNISEGIADFLKKAKSKNKKIIIISNTPGANVEREILKENKIFDFFDAFYFSCEVGIRKPHPEIFERAINDFNILKSEVVHIGDRPELDIVGAKNAGIFSIYYNPKGYKYPDNFPKPDFEIKNFEELERFL
ncbi:MAG: HAD family hydrolase [candidate division WOR-3 bacterium]